MRLRLPRHAGRLKKARLLAMMIACALALLADKDFSTPQSVENNTCIREKLAQNVRLGTLIITPNAREWQPLRGAQGSGASSTRATVRMLLKLQSPPIGQGLCTKVVRFINLSPLVEPIK